MQRTLRANLGRFHYLLLRRAIVKLAALSSAIVAKAIPLRARLGVEGDNVVIDGPWGLVHDTLVKDLSFEGRRLHAVERPVCRHAHAIHDFLGGFDGRLGRQEVDGAKLVVVAV